MRHIQESPRFYIKQKLITNKHQNIVPSLDFTEFIDLKNKVYLLGRFLRAEDAGAVHLSDSVSHKHSLSLEARGSSGAPSLQVREDRHHISSLHV